MSKRRRAMKTAQDTLPVAGPQAASPPAAGACNVCPPTLQQQKVAEGQSSRQKERSKVVEVVGRNSHTFMIHDQKYI